MGRRRGDIFSKRSYNYGSRLVTNLFTGFIAAPFALLGALPSSSSSLEEYEPISKRAAIILLVIGVALAPIFIPWFALGFEYFDFPFIGVFITFAIIFIPLMVWGAILFLSIESLWKRRNESITGSQAKAKKPNQYESFVTSLVGQDSNSDYSNIRLAYYDTLHANKALRSQIQSLEKSIHLLEVRVKRYKYISYLREKQQSNLDSKRLLLNKLQSSIASETIVTRQQFRDSIENIRLNSDVLLSLNMKIEQHQRMNLSRLSKNVEKENYFFNVDSLPRFALLFNSIEICFYKDYLLFMSKDDFAVIDRKNVSMAFNLTNIEINPLNVLPNHKVVGTSWKFSRNDGGPDLRYKNNTCYSVVEVGVLEINIANQTINLIFSSGKIGRKIYHIVS